MRKRNEQWLAACAAFGVAALFVPAPVFAAPQILPLSINQSKLLPAQSSAIKRVTVTNPDIADVNVLSAHEIQIIGKKTGSTSLMLWTADGMRQEFLVTVSGADTGLAQAIHDAIGLPHVKVEVVNGKAILTGTVANQAEKDMAVRVAALYVTQQRGSSGGSSNSDDATQSNTLAGSRDDDRDLLSSDDVKVDDRGATDPNVVDLLEMINPDQINIEAEVIEIDADDAKEIGMEYGSDSTVSSPGTWYALEGTTNRDAKSHWYTRNWLYTHFSTINAKIHTLVTRGHARIVSRPNITTMSGKTAGILVGGEIPYPVNNNNSTSVQYKTYGIQLNLINPVVDSAGNVTSRVYASVSRLDWANAVTVEGFSMPATRRSAAETMVNIPSGMTMVIGGLLNSDDEKNLTKIPILGDIPILGELFKYHNDTKNKSEIMILLTPRIVNETTPAQMSTEMKDLYVDLRHEDQLRHQVNLNDQNLPKTEKELKRERRKAKKESASGDRPVKRSEAADSILGKYLDQDVLKAATPEEREAAGQ